LNDLNQLRIVSLSSPFAQVVNPNPSSAKQNIAVFKAMMAMQAIG
jgi:hypothetical protein